MKILVTGSHGMLGTDLVSLLRTKDVEVLDTSHNELDITRKEDVLAFVLKCVPDIIVNCAAFTNVDKCETEKEAAFKVNALGAGNVATAANKCGARIIHISTDFVFDGYGDRPYVEEDQTNTLSEYGRSKLEGERNIQNISNNYLIARTSWLYGHHRINFVEKMLELAKKRKELSIVNDEISSPTYTVDLAEAIWSLIEHKSEGLFHVANDGSCSRAEWAKRIFEIMNYDIDIQPIKAHEYKRPAKVPLNSTLNCQKLMTATGFRMRAWGKAFEEYMKKRPQAL